MLIVIVYSEQFTDNAKSLSDAIKNKWSDASVNLMGTFGKSESFVVGSFVVTGRDIGTVIAMNVDLVSGSFTLTGQDAVFIYGTSAILENGSYTVTGRDITFNKQVKISADVGVYVYTGKDITVRGWLEPFVGAETWAGQAVLPKHGRTLRSVVCAFNKG